MIEFSVNKTWQNWQGRVDKTAINSLLSEGAKNWPMAFTTDYTRPEQLDKINDWARQKHEEGVKTLIVIGMGGSSLGGQTIEQYYSPGSGKLYFWEGSHPQILQVVGKLAEQQKTAILWVSKSAQTIESKTNLALFKQFFPEVEVTFVTSEPDKALPMGSNDQNTFLMPDKLDGRFSIVGPGALLPGAFLGADMQSYLKGYEQGISKWHVSIPLDDNAAKKVAVQYFNMLQNLFQGVVFWIYAHELIALTGWLTQVWGEALGKNAGVSAIPLMARGPEDQHTALQYYMRGPNHFVHTFIHTQSYGTFDTIVPQRFPGEFGNHSQWEILTAQMKGVEHVLTEQNRPVAEFIVPSLYSMQGNDPHKNSEMGTLGEMVAFWLYVTTYIAYLYRIDPFEISAIQDCQKVTRQFLNIEEDKRPADPVTRFIEA